MNQGLEKIISALKAGYDKLALFLVLSVLLFSAFRLISRLGQERAELNQKSWEQPPANFKRVEPADFSAITDAAEKLEHPFQISVEPTNTFMTAEKRVACVNCGKPIPYDARLCPFCRADQPEWDPDLRVDSDGDGMLDEWEKKFGLNPFNSNDALLDLDGDGFTNLEEFLWKTNAADAEDFPPLAAKLRLIAVRKVPFNLMFIGKHSVSESSVFFALKNKQNLQDYYVKKGDTIDGFLIADYEEKIITITKNDLKISEDVSVLVLQKDDKLIRLPRGRDVEQTEYVAALHFTLDEHKFTVKLGDKFNLRQQEYKVVDITPDFVIVSDETTSLKYKVDGKSASLLEQAPAEQPDKPSDGVEEE